MKMKTTTTVPDGVLCEWFALCDHQAVGAASHPVLAWVPICQRCADRFGLEVFEAEWELVS
jgi:hypothetical protein